MHTLDRQSPAVTYALNHNNETRQERDTINWGKPLHRGCSRCCRSRSSPTSETSSAPVAGADNAPATVATPVALE